MPTGWQCVDELCTIAEWPETVMKYDMSLDSFLNVFFSKDFSVMYLNKKIDNELQEKQAPQLRRIKV